MWGVLHTNVVINGWCCVEQCVIGNFQEISKQWVSSGLAMAVWGVTMAVCVCVYRGVLCNSICRPKQLITEKLYFV